MSRLIPVIWCRHGGLLFVFLLTGFVMCKAGPESGNHLILQCPIALALLNRLVREAMLSWVIPANCMGETVKDANSFGGRRKDWCLKDML